jgi:heme-degrading monooxygenase HmoA
VWGRVTTFVFPADDVNKAVAHLDRAVDAFLRQPGLAHIDVFLDRRSGAALTVSLWESEEAMKATEDEADRLRNEIAPEVLGWIESVSEYELVRSVDP